MTPFFLGGGAFSCKAIALDGNPKRLECIEIRTSQARAQNLKKKKKKKVAENKFNF